MKFILEGYSVDTWSRSGMGYATFHVHVDVLDEVASYLRSEKEIPINDCASILPWEVDISVVLRRQSFDPSSPLLQDPVVVRIVGPIRRQEVPT